MAEEWVRRHGNYEGQTISPDLRFAIDFVLDAGEGMFSLREMAAAADKVDATLVTTVDKLNDKKFARAVLWQYGSTVPVHSEEGRTVNPSNYEECWVIDPLDGTGEYGSTHWDPITGKLIRAGEPIPPNAVLIEDTDRSSCVAVTRFVRGEPDLAVVYAPYKDELFVADVALGGAYLNGHRLDLSTGATAQQTFQPGIPYDFATWRGSLLDPRHLRRDLGREPNNTYSAVMQACEVAAGRSMTCIFTGTSLHDMAGVLIVKLARGWASDIHGNQHDWSNPQGAVYSANQMIHEGVLATINAPRIDGLPPGYIPVGKNEVTAEEILALRNQAAFGTERRLSVWADALAGSYAFTGARERSTGRLVLASFLTGTSRHGTLHDLVVHPDYRRQGFASYAIDKRVELAKKYRIGEEVVGMSYLEVDLGVNRLGMIPLKECFDSHGFESNIGALIRDYRHKSSTKT